MKDYPCPVCGCRSNKVLYPDTLGEKVPCVDYNWSPLHKETYRIVRCTDCGHGYCSPRPEEFTSNYENVCDPKYLIHQKHRVETAKRVMPVLRKYVPQRGKLLDIGCATGDFLSVAGRFYEVEGLEFSRWSCEIANNKGFTVYNCGLENIGHKDYYDAITLWSVIEHFEQPSDEIGHIRRLLKPGGFVFLWTGDLDGLPSRLLKAKWWYILGQHVQFFTSNSLKKLFTDNGFSLQWSGIYPYVTTGGLLLEALGRYSFFNKFRKYLIRQSIISNIALTVKLPGEIFAVFKKDK